MTNKKRTRAGSEAQYGPRTVGEILHDFFENSNEPLAVAFRKWKARNKDAKTKEGDEPARLFVDLFPDTFLDVDLKLLTRKPGRMPVGDCLSGVLARDGEEHFCFIENASEKKVVAVRNPHLFRGKCVNVIKKDDTLYLTFNRPQFSEEFTFQDFCFEAAEELRIVASLLGESSIG